MGFQLYLPQLVIWTLISHDQIPSTVRQALIGSESCSLRGTEFLGKFAKASSGLVEKREQSGGGFL